MVSIRRPKVLTIRGNDQKEHKFLDKGGEDQRQDQRQDQRIEILFELINDLLKLDSKRYQRNLSIKT
jgi:DNA-dependent protein kinase catalytic subunit